MPDEAKRASVAALEVATRAAERYLEGLDERSIPASIGIDEVKDALGRDLPEHGEPPAEVIERLVRGSEPGLIAIPNPRFFGWVMGGTQPAAIAADWLVSAWDQNTGMRDITPGTVGAEELAAAWIIDLLGLPAQAEVAFVTGGMMANFTCLTAARDEVLRRAGHNVAEKGLAGCPPVRVLVGAERHDTVDKSLRLLGLGAAVAVDADDQGRIRVDALERELARGEGPTIVALQAGNVHSGAFDPFDAAIDAAHAAGAWVHIDGAFGLWAAASPRLRGLTRAIERADSWATDAHKTLSVPYDCGVAIVADRAAMRAAMGVSGAYLSVTDSEEHLDPYHRTPELSRRARGVPTWAALRAMGRSGTIALVDRLAGSASALATGLAGMPGVEVLNDVVFTQVCIALEDDDRTAALGEALRAGGEAFASSSRWRDRGVLRFSVSNWGTDQVAVDRTLAAVRRALSSI